MGLWFKVHAHWLRKRCHVIPYAAVRAGRPDVLRSLM